MFRIMYKIEWSCNRKIFGHCHSKFNIDMNVTLDPSRKKIDGLKFTFNDAISSKKTFGMYKQFNFNKSIYVAIPLIPSGQWSIRFQ